MFLEVAVVVLVLAVVALGFLLARQGSAPAESAEMQALRAELNVMRETTQNMSVVFASQLQAVSANMQSAVSNVSTDVATRLDAINSNVAQRLHENQSAMASTSQSVTQRIEGVQKTFSELQKQIGEMSQQARQIAEVSKGIGDLERILSAPKLRGGLGEMQLENLLSQVFAREQYEIQYRFNSGDLADALVHLPQGDVVIDSKFSLENFRRMAEAQNDADRKAARREFIKDVRRRIDEIASKYIRPAEGTLPLALMYVPAENVYYEAIIRDENGDDIYNYCVQRRVFPVSPNSLYAYLQTIIVGMNGMRVSQRAETILREIQSLRLELEGFDEIYSKLGTHLKNAVNSYEASGREMQKLENRLQSLAGVDAQKSLFGEALPEKKRALGAGE